MSRLAHAVGLVVGYAGVALALRMADAVDARLEDAARQAAAAATEDEAIAAAADQLGARGD